MSQSFPDAPFEQEEHQSDSELRAEESQDFAVEKQMPGRMQTGTTPRVDDSEDSTTKDQPASTSLSTEPSIPSPLRSVHHARSNVSQQASSFKRQAPEELQPADCDSSSMGSLGAQQHDFKRPRLSPSAASISAPTQNLIPAFSALPRIRQYSSRSNEFASSQSPIPSASARPNPSQLYEPSHQPLRSSYSHPALLSAPAVGLPPEARHFMETCQSAHSMRAFSNTGRQVDINKLQEVTAAGEAFAAALARTHFPQYQGAAAGSYGQYGNSQSVNGPSAQPQYGFPPVNPQLSPGPHQRFHTPAPSSVLQTPPGSAPTATTHGQTSSGNSQSQAQSGPAFAPGGPFGGNGGFGAKQ